MLKVDRFPRGKEPSIFIVRVYTPEATMSVNKFGNTCIRNYASTLGVSYKIVRRARPTTRVNRYVKTIFSQLIKTLVLDRNKFKNFTASPCQRTFSITPLTLLLTSLRESINYILHINKFCNCFEECENLLRHAFWICKLTANRLIDPSSSKSLSDNRSLW